MPKIAMIGAGSVVFAKNLIGDILAYPELRDTQFALMDIDTERLETAELMTRKIIRQRDAAKTAKVAAHRDRLAALEDADYVINMIQVGGFPATLLDFDIPEKHGLKQTIGDTMGVGGIMRALRTIPVVVDLCHDMEEVCPNALLMNYSNPMAMNCWAACEASDINVVGLCHGIRMSAHQVARHLGVDKNTVTYRCGGINHMAWFVDLWVNGEDAYPALFRAIENDEVFMRDAVRFALMEKVGYFMTESSEHIAEYLPYFIQHEDLIEELKIPIREYVRRCEGLLGRFDEMKKLVKSDAELPLRPSGEYCSEIVHSIETGQPRVVNGNVPNFGLIPNLPEGCCVEVPCLVDSNGVQPTQFGDLPPQCAALNRLNVNVQELAVRAALDGRRDHVYHAAMLDPHTSSLLTMDEIVDLCDELIAEHSKRGYMPRLD
ncbi:MAG: alpha-glucosidase/alpha-galactosidase [Candidatus Sumerlaeota bacterium]|nr:alpha-glucosidase/alpha-galactosidase [Candidatus Sumerlaeota bacterium]